MAFIIPKKIEKLTHGGVVKALLVENREYTVPNRTNWPKHVPDLVHRTKKITVEIELSDLDRAWGQCLSYYRLGSDKIHLLLTPNLFQQYEQDERSYVAKNPIPNITIHKLPVVKKKRGRPSQKTVKREVTISNPDKKFYEPTKPKRLSPMLEPWKDIDILKTRTAPKLRSLSGKKRGRPKRTQGFKPNSAEPCEYCHIFESNPVLGHTLCCGRIINAGSENSVYEPDTYIHVYENPETSVRAPKKHRWDSNKETGLSTCTREGCGITVKNYRVKHGGITSCKGIFPRKMVWIKEET